MEQETLKNSSEYIKNLPKPVQDLIFDGIWLERTEEIAKKYSLNEPQTESLTDDVLFVLVGLKKPEDFLQTIIGELTISRLLAEQIVEDVENRVFDYAIKEVGGKEDKKNPDRNQEAETDTNPNIPENRPEITPMVEPEEKVRVRPVPVGFTGATPKTQIPTPEPVQRPVSVPRYTAIHTEEEKNESVVQKNTTPVAEKLNATIQAEPTRTPEPVPPPVKKYTVDPYREPLE